MRKDFQSHALEYVPEATNRVILLDDLVGINWGTVLEQLLKNENFREN